MKESTEIKRTLTTIPDDVFKSNSPHDYVDYSLSFYLPETSDRITDALNEFYARIGKILEDDRRKAKEKEKGLHVAAGPGRRPRNPRLID